MGVTGLETAFAVLYTSSCCPGVLPLDAAGRAHDRRRRTLRIAPADARARGRRRTSAWSTSRHAGRWGRRATRAAPTTPASPGASCSGRVLMTLAAGSGRLPRARLRDPARGRSRGVHAPGARVKLDRSRAALVVVDVQEAFRPAVLDFEQVAANVAVLVAGRACWDCRRSSPSSTRRASGARCPRWPSTSTASTPIEKVCFSAVDADGFSARASRHAPRPGPAVRDRVPRVREPDRRGPARGRRSRSTSPRTRSLRAPPRTARSACTRWSARARRDERRDGSVRAAAPGRHA